MTVDRAATVVARGLLRGTASALGPARREWLDALLAELDTVPRGPGRVVWALGGLRLAAVLAVRRGSRTAWWRHPGRSVALLLGAPAGTLGHRRPGAAGTGSYLVAVACAVTAGLSVLVLRGLLEDSPYPFNAGQGAPAGLHPDWGNPMSLAFDVVVLASLAELLGILALTACFLRFTAAGCRRLPRPLRVALLASALPLWVLVGATLLLGFAAARAAPTVFDQARAAGVYLTWTSWVGLAVVMAAAAAGMTVAGTRRRRVPKPPFRTKGASSGR